jgi:hypothetical protein
MSVRDVEVRLASLEDKILSNLGYREYTLKIGTTSIPILPGITQKNMTSYTPAQLQGFADKLGGQGNPIAIFKLALSREIPEATVRQFAYWYLTRSGYEAKCMPIDIIVTDSRYIITLAVLKQTTPNP